MDTHTDRDPNTSALAHGYRGTNEYLDTYAIAYGYRGANEYLDTYAIAHPTTPIARSGRDGRALGFRGPIQHSNKPEQEPSRYYGKVSRPDIYFGASLQ